MDKGHKNYCHMFLKMVNPNVHKLWKVIVSPKSDDLDHRDIA